MATATVVETTPGSTNSGNQIFLNLPERLTVKELIRLYIDHQMTLQLSQCDNSHEPTFFLTGDAGSNADPAKGENKSERASKEPDAHALYKRAWNGFEKNQFVVLVNELQVSELDEEVSVGRDMRVKFLRLTPLIGG
jgi:hypothetical protein